MIETAETLARGNPWAFRIWYEDLTPEEQLGLKVALGLDAFQRACRALAEVFDQICDAIIEAVQAIIEWIRTFYPLLLRLSLYGKLRRWYVPHWLALWLAQYWPRRWLSGGMA